MPRFLLFAVATGLALLLSACDATSTEPTAEVVVESYQIAGEPLADVRLTRTVSVSSTFSADDAAVVGARVRLEELDAAGTVVDRHRYVALGDPGVYSPEDPKIIVRPTVTYRLVAEVPDGGRVTATTTVPDTISVLRAVDLEAVFQGPAQPSFTVTRSGTREGQDVFVFTVTSLLNFNQPQETLVRDLTPFYADAFDTDGDVIEDLRVNPSPVLNERNYDRNPDGTITIDLPWIAVAFYGPNRAAVNVLDTNYYDFLRSRQAQQNGRPGEIPNVIDRVEGGTGLFGSFARTEVDVFIRRPPGL